MKITIAMEDFKHIDKFSDWIKHDELKILEPTTQELDKLRLLVCSDLTQKHIWEETGEIYTGFSAKQQEDYDWFLDMKETSNGCFLVKDKNILYKANSFEETIFYALSILNLSVGDFLIITIQKDSYK